MEQFEMNRRGIRVKKGCFSCAHRHIDWEEQDENLRTCMLDKQKHPSCYLCANWKMRAGLQKAGISGGVVRDIDTKAVVIH